MTELTHLECPDKTECGSSDAYTWNDTKEQGYCHSCELKTWTFKGELWGKRGSAKGKPLESSTDMTTQSTAVVEDFTPKAITETKGSFVGTRGITSSTMEKFGVRTTGDKQEYPYPSGGIKTRNLTEKAFSTTQGFKTDELFGMNLFPVNSSRIVTITEGECFTPNTEVFTPNGWVALEDYKNEPVAVVGQDQKWFFTTPEAVVDKQYYGDLIEYRSGSYYSLTTENHNLVRLDKEGKLVKTKAKYNTDAKTPRVFDVADPYEEYPELDLRLWIMLSADFTFRKEGDIYGAFKKLRKVERAKELLDQKGVRYSCNPVSGDYYSIFIHRGHGLVAQKDLPMPIIWHPKKEELLEELIFWDGNYVKTRNQAEFSTNRKHNADVVQMLSHSCGYTSSIIYRSNEYGEWMKVSILFGKRHSTTQKGYTRFPYEGRVMCLTVSTGMLVVRQKGSISISGNCDAMSAWQMLSAGSTYLNPVVSFPSASPSGKLWEKCKGYLDSFEKIILSVDRDDAGDRLAEKVSQIFPGKVYRMEHGSYKDANDFLQAGDTKAFKSAWWGAKKIKPDSILCTSEDFLDLYENTPDFEYCPTGIPDLDNKILGLNKGYYTVIVAPTGLGKTEFMRYLEYQVLTRSTYKFAYMHLEESQLRSTLGMVSYKLNDNLTRKDLIEQKGRVDDVKAALVELGDTERMHQFSLGTDEDHNDLIDRIKYLVAAMDVDFVFFEPIQDIVDGDMKDKESKLSDLSSKLSRLASEVNVGIITIAHANEDGDTMYCKMIAKKAAFEITLERDQTAETHEERNRTYVHVGRKNRVGGGSGPAGALDFDLDSYTLKVVEGPKEPKTDNKGDF